MIASNFIRHPDALRFQRELFHNGYKNSPRIMRLMECVFKFARDVPGWVKEAARKAGQILINFKSRDKGHLVKAGYYVHPMFGNTWCGRGMVPKWLQILTANGDSLESYRLAVDTWIPWAM